MRTIDSTMNAGLAAQAISLAVLCQLTFASGMRCVWSGVGDLVYSGKTYTGVGSLGSIGDISGGIDVQAQGTSITLSGIDPIYLGEAMTDIQVGAPAKILLALMSAAGAVLGVPYLLYGGTVDVPTVTMGPNTCSISLKIENRMLDLQRAQQQRYTAADQHLKYPTDTGFNWVEILNDQVLAWGR